MLFEDIIFGPIFSRRLGSSLGVNLLPEHKKICNFDCVYCECGWNDETIDRKEKIHTKKEIEEALDYRLKEIAKEGIKIDSITFSGNGEPSLHPEFAEIIDIVTEKRDLYCKGAKISVLSNATTLSNPKVFEALKKIDNPILKLDSARREMFYQINKANPNVVSFEDTVNNLIRFGSDSIIQTLLLRGENDGKRIDNTTKEEFEAWLEVVEKVRPRSVMLYAIDRVTPESNLEKLSKDELETFAQRVRALNIETNTY